MKIEFKKDVYDNKVKFESLKAGDTFSFGDPKSCNHEVFMKINSPKEISSTYDCINLGNGRLSSYYTFKREIISVDQEFVYKLDATLNVVLT